MKRPSSFNTTYEKNCTTRLHYLSSHLTREFGSLEIFSNIPRVMKSLEAQILKY